MIRRIALELLLGFTIGAGAFVGVTAAVAVLTLIA